MIGSDDSMQDTLPIGDQQMVIVDGSFGDDGGRVVGRSPIRVHKNCPSVWEVLCQAGAHCMDNVAYRVGIVIAGYADDDFGRADLLQAGFSLGIEGSPIAAHGVLPTASATGFQA